MKGLRKLFVGAATGAALVSTILAAGCAQISSHGNDGSPLSENPATAATTPKTTLPLETTMTQPPAAPAITEMDLGQLVAEFKTDPKAAEARYAGKRFLFRNVKAEDLSSVHKPYDWDMYVLNGKVKFRPEYPSRIGDLKINSVMDIEGTVWGTQTSFIIISDCRYTVTDTSQAIDRPDFQSTFA